MHVAPWESTCPLPYTNPGSEHNVYQHCFINTQSFSIKHDNLTQSQESKEFKGVTCASRRDSFIITCKMPNEKQNKVSSLIATNRKDNTTKTFNFITKWKIKSSCFKMDPTQNACECMIVWKKWKLGNALCNFCLTHY